MGWPNPLGGPDTTEKQFKKVAVHGGRINTTYQECWILDCEEPRPHYHLVCSRCGCVDLADTKCPSCKAMRKVMKIQRDMEQWRKDNWKALTLGRLLVVVILFTIAVWKGGTN
jgi:hypothetical protein